MIAGNCAEVDVSDDKLTPLCVMSLSSLDAMSMDMCAHLSTVLMSSANMTSPPRDDDVLGLTPISPLSSSSQPPSPFTECTQSCHCCHTLSHVTSDFAQYKHALTDERNREQQHVALLQTQLHSVQCAYDEHKSQCALTMNRQSFQIDQLKDALKHAHAARAALESKLKSSKSEVTRDAADTQSSSSSSSPQLALADDVTCDDENVVWINDNDNTITSSSSSGTRRPTTSATKTKRITPDCTLRKCVATRKSLINVASVLQKASDIQKQQQQTIRKQSTQIDVLTKRNEALLAKLEQMKTASASAIPRRSLKRKRRKTSGMEEEEEVSERRRRVMSANELSLTDDDVNAMSVQIEAELFTQDDEHEQHSNDTASQDTQQETDVQPPSPIDISSDGQSVSLTHIDNIDERRRSFCGLISTAVAFLANPYSVASAVKAHFKLICDRIRPCRCTSAAMHTVWPISSRSKLSESSLNREAECAHSHQMLDADQLALDEAVREMINVLCEQYVALLESQSVDAADKVWCRGITMITEIAKQHELRCSETTSPSITFSLELPMTQILTHTCVDELFSANTVMNSRKQSLLVAYVTLLQRLGYEQRLWQLCQELIHFHSQMPLTLLDVFARFHPALFNQPSIQSTHSTMIASLRLVIACAISKHNESSAFPALSSAVNSAMIQLQTSSAFDLWQPIIQELISHLSQWSKVTNTTTRRQFAKNTVVAEENLLHLSTAIHLFIHSVGLAIAFSVMKTYFIPLVATANNNFVHTLVYCSLADMCVYATQSSHTVNTKNVVVSLLEFLLYALNNPKNNLSAQQIRLVTDRTIQSLIAARSLIAENQPEQLTLLETKMNSFASSILLSKDESASFPYVHEYKNFLNNGCANVLQECLNKRKAVS